MISLTQHLKSWRCLASLSQHYCHHRLLTSSVAKSESQNITDQENSFGRIAVGRQKKRLEKEKNGPSRKFPKHVRGFFKLIHSDSSGKDIKHNKGFLESAHSHFSRNLSGISQDSIVENWHQFRNNKYQDTLVSWESDQQDDAEEDYNCFVSGNASILEDEGWKDSSQKTVESLKKNVIDINNKKEKLHKLVKKKRNFGSLSPLYEEPEGDDRDRREERYQSAKLERQHRPNFYGFKMKKLCKERKLGEAISVLEEEMPAAGSKPNHYCFQVLINACGRAGYTKKAFQLYNQMKKHGLKVEPVAYTGLFLACAHSPWPTTDGLQRATHLRSYLLEKNFQFNQIICHAMIKAFGWCGDMGTAFQVVDEMIQDGIMVTTETMSFLLQACITNKEAGFWHAMKVWRKMRELKLQPNIHSYNHLMHIMKDCGAGDPKFIIDLLKENDQLSLEDKTNPSKKYKVIPETLNLNVKSLNSEKNLRKIQEDSVVHHLEINDSKENMNENLSKSVLPNILGKRLTSRDAVALGTLDHPSDRLAFLGGPSNILMQMKRDKITPDLKTFTQMLESLPPDTQAEQVSALIESMKNFKLQPDTQFFNMLIKKRNFRQDIKAAREVITQMQHYHLLPDLITYGCLALGCHNLHSASQLLKDMDVNFFQPNIEIMTILVKNSLVKQDYTFTVAMLRKMQEKAVSPHDLLLSELERARIRARKILMDENENSTKTQEKEKKAAKVFLSAYKIWLKDTEVQLPEHPWTQYQ
ncbi:pentatricopeptide repeat-containing protein 1, mitochondrial-like isoform X3 [Portunus trituberculatus]|uniref:pentatricopeptide repeat-containing protein 1, mitochondrial-like isoform X3 n=1 Tax=Portunus trituberculatus TaxID=210409 RepID=UPI001E1CBA2D|nr:pentatricopeptide repeat-containing protein 1, mitochondrial-like isoform X3 [Portunus trituberculatus]